MDGVRFAIEADAAALAAIYAPIVTDTWISFEETPPSVVTMRERIVATLQTYPYLCYERGGRVAGYAYAGRHRERAAYRWSVDVSVYVAAGHRRSGIAAELYRALFEQLVARGYYNAFAGITLPNDASVGFHRRLGFRDVGVYHNVGYKFGAWHDTLWLERPLRSASEAPREPATGER